MLLLISEQHGQIIANFWGGGENWRLVKLVIGKLSGGAENWLRMYFWMRVCRSTDSRRVSRVQSAKIRHDKILILLI